MTLDEFRNRLSGERVFRIDYSFCAGNDSDKNCFLDVVLTMDADGSCWSVYRVTHKGQIVLETGAFSSATRHYWEIVFGGEK